MTAKRLIRDETTRQAIRFAVNKLSKAAETSAMNFDKLAKEVRGRMK